MLSERIGNPNSQLPTGRFGRYPEQRIIEDVDFFDRRRGLILLFLKSLEARNKVDVTR
jgi:hypothetical protein